MNFFKYWQLYALVVVAFALGLFGLRASFIKEGEAKAKSKINEQRIKDMKDAQNVQNEVEALDTDSLKRRASVWVRSNRKK